MDNRCKEKHPKLGAQCGLPKGHGGQHRNGTIVPAWGGIEELPTPKTFTITGEPKTIASTAVFTEVPLFDMILREGVDNER